MENFAKDHYILLPQPFSSKTDMVSTMPIPNIIPANLYPIFRQQAYLNNTCIQSQDNTSKKDACSRYKVVMHLLKEVGFCKQEQVQLAQSYTSHKIVSYKWVKCPIAYQ